MAHLLELPSKCAETLLRPLVIDMSVVVLLEGSIMLVQRIVGKMSVLVMSVVGHVLGVFDSRQPDQALLIDVDPKRSNTSNCHINSEVELVAIEQHRVVDVLADDRALF